ncbi:MAG: dihydrolipoamide acetyltransferase family protein, partial [Deltaproteobacteria bacterium]|nr:dihydrolipoamide acetyltransferase family protein [Deltaproteobacteria bacterium]
APRPAAPAAGDRKPLRPTVVVRDDEGGERVKASPLARTIAGERGIDLATVVGSGPGGRIVERDLEDAAPAAAPRAREAAAPAAAKAPAESPRGRVELSKIRRTTAKRMAEAKRDIPHFYVTAEVDMTEAMHLRQSIKRREAMPGLTVTHLLVRALAVALVRHPNVNGSWRDGAIELHDDVNIGIAVAVDEGLVVPVLHRAQTLSLSEIAARASELTERARQHRFSGDDLSGSTFSISNVGMLDIEELTAVINPPNAAILAVGSVKERPIVRAGQLAVAQTMRATLSCDHRVLNGLEGGRFLEELKSILENPVTLLLE